MKRLGQLFLGRSSSFTSSGSQNTSPLDLRSSSEGGNEEKDQQQQQQQQQRWPWSISRSEESTSNHSSFADAASLSHQLSLKAIKAATSNFSRKCEIGRGGFAVVYMGEMDVQRSQDEGGGMKRTKVAVKRMKEENALAFRDYLNEVRIMSEISHPNIVRLIGCCSEEKETIIVSELLEGGDMNTALKESMRGELDFPWDARVNVACDLACAIAFLHNNKIIHRDVKPSNVLLTPDFDAKLSDMGFSRLCEGRSADSEIVTKHIIGSACYIDPEYFSTGVLHQKSDVYSFGVVLLELITGKLMSFTLDKAEEQHGFNGRNKGAKKGRKGAPEPSVKSALIPAVFGQLLQDPKNAIEEFIDAQLDGKYSKKQAIRMVIIAQRCLNMHRDDRAKMVLVSRLLNQLRDSY